MKRIVVLSTVSAVGIALSGAASSATGQSHLIQGVPIKKGGIVDLVPVRRPGSTGAEGYCRRDGAGNLLVRIKNLGIGASNNGVARVTFQFRQGGTVVVAPRDAAYGSIVGGGTAFVAVPIPGGCFDSDCDFAIDVTGSTGQESRACSCSTTRQTASASASRVDCDDIRAGGRCHLSPMLDRSSTLSHSGESGCGNAFSIKFAAVCLAQPCWTKRQESRSHVSRDVANLSGDY